MARVLVFQHVAAEPLGTLDPLIRQRRHRIRFINFSRDPDAAPNIDRYDALVVLGGPMNVHDADRHAHLTTEMHAIDRALTRGIPVLGICLGSQLLAHVLGARVERAPHWEIGWYPIRPTVVGAKDPVMGHINDTATVFQWHQCAFDIPADAHQLATGSPLPNQAFRYGDCAYGFQFHLEMEQRLIERWLNHPAYRDELEAATGTASADEIRQQMAIHLPQMERTAHRVFGSFLDQIGTRVRKVTLPSR